LTFHAISSAHPFSLDCYAIIARGEGVWGV
jgi:hypothetical protein